VKEGVAIGLFTRRRTTQPNRHEPDSAGPSPRIRSLGWITSPKQSPIRSEWDLTPDQPEDQAQDE
jgi:hypothetical protein